MADVADNGEFWLPSHFLSDVDSLMDKENVCGNGGDGGLSSVGMFSPSQFPYGFEDVFHSFHDPNRPLQAQIDERDLAAEVTRRLVRSTIHRTSKLSEPVKSRILPVSPQPAFSAIQRSFESHSSLSKTPMSMADGAWGAIYAAAGPAMKCRVGGQLPCNRLHLHRQRQHREVFRCACDPLLCMSTANLDLKRCQATMQHDLSFIWGGLAMEPGYSSVQSPRFWSRGRIPVGREGGFPLSKGSPQEPPQTPFCSRTGAAFAASGERSGLPKKSTGTGVFLPRKYGNPVDSPRKFGSPSVPLPPRVARSPNSSSEPVNKDEASPSPLDCGALTSLGNAERRRLAACAGRVIYW